jgi:hypothetical protein
MQTWQTKPTLKKARQWREGDEFPGVMKEVKGTGSDGVQYNFFVITIHGQKTYLTDGDYVVEEPDGKHHYPCKPDIWLKGHELLDEQRALQTMLQD